MNLTVAGVIPVETQVEVYHQRYFLIMHAWPDFPGMDRRNFANSYLAVSNQSSLATALTTLVFLLGLYLATGSIYPTGMLIGFQNPLEATGRWTSLW